MDVDSTMVDGVVGRSLANGFVEVRMADGVLRICFLSRSLREAGAVIAEGDRVVLAPEEEGILRGEIRRVRAEPRAAPEPAEMRPSLLIRSDPGRLKPEDQRIDRNARPGWRTGAECPPRIGDVVYCTAGLGTVLRVLGRTGNGTSLLELRLPTAGKVSFFASASNVLMAPRDASMLPAGATSS